jgi:hypothetical protein
LPSSYVTGLAAFSNAVSFFHRGCDLAPDCGFLSGHALDRNKTHEAGSGGLASTDMNKILNRKLTALSISPRRPVAQACERGSRHREQGA